jgi:hypothetical protein
MSLCPATRKGKNPRWPISCTLDENHMGPHIAYGPGGIIVKQWVNPEKTNMQRVKKA